MPTPLKQASFVGGEIDPALYGRTDLDRYAQSVRTCRNFIVRPAGSAVNRPGTKFIREVKDSTKATRLIPFVFNANDAYALELGDYYMRFHRAGATIMDNGSPYEIDTPWSEDQIFELQFAQLNDVLFVTHQSFRAYELKRYDHDNWTLDVIDLAAPVNPPTGLVVDDAPVAVDPGHPHKDWDWVVTSEDQHGNESVPSVPVSLTDSRCLFSDRSAVELSWLTPTQGNGPVKYHVYRGRHGVHGYVGTTEDAEFHDEGFIPAYEDAPPSARDPFLVDGGDPVLITRTSNLSGSPAVATKTEAAEAYDDQYTFRYSVDLGRLETVTLKFESRNSGAPTWNDHGNKVYTASSFKPVFYEEENTVTQDGLVAAAEFRITGVSGDGNWTAFNVKWGEQLGDNEDTPTYPRAVCFFEQRLTFGGFSENPAQIVTSRTGAFRNFDTSTPSKDDDSVDITLASVRLDEIRALVPLEALLVLTSGAEWLVRGAEGGPLTPASYDAKPRTYHGANAVMPEVVGKSALYVAERGRTVRELMYDPSGSAMQVRDLGIMSRHLFEDYSVVDWAYADTPFNCLWAVRADGTLLGLTFVKEHEVVAWHRHDTEGSFEAVCSIPEGAEHAVYCIVNRTVDGNTKRYVELFATRNDGDLEDAIFMDCALTQSGDYAGAVTMTLSDGAPWAAGGSATLTASSAMFGGMVGQRVELDGYRVHIADLTSTSVATVVLVDPIPAALQGTAATSWSWAVNYVTGLDHLEGESVTLLVDGQTVADQTVASGEITDLPVWGETIHAGLGVTADLEPVWVDTREGKLTDRVKTISRVSVEVKDTSSVQVGEDLEHLSEAVPRKVSDDYDLSDPESSIVDVVPRAAWGPRVGVSIRQDKPLPVEVLSIIPRVKVGM